MEFVNITGLGNTGSSALVDLMLDYKSACQNCHRNSTYEHTMMWHPDALIETYTDLKKNYFGLQSDATIRKFKKKMQDLMVTYGGNEEFVGKRKLLLDMYINNYVTEICIKEGDFLSTVVEASRVRRTVKRLCKNKYTAKMKWLHGGGYKGL